MKKIISILIALVMCMSLSSCITTAQAQDDGVYDDNVDISIVISNGTPYYNSSGLLLYYMYRDCYYYPFYYNNRYYFHRYHRPLPPSRMNRYRPVPRDFYKHRPPHRYHVTPPNRSTYHIRPNSSHRPNIGNHRHGNGNIGRQQMHRTQPRNGGRFGGRR